MRHSPVHGGSGPGGEDCRANRFSHNAATVQPPASCVWTHDPQREETGRPTTGWITLAGHYVIRDHHRPLRSSIHPCDVHRGQVLPGESLGGLCTCCSARPVTPSFHSLDETTLLTPRRLITYMRTALHLIGHPAATYVTVHSLRRSGAQAAARAWVSESDIMAHGTWKSEALYAYTPKQLYPQVPTTLASLFGR